MSLTLNRNVTRLIGAEFGQKTQKEDLKSRFASDSIAIICFMLGILTLNRNVTQLLDAELEQKTQKEDLKSRFVYTKIMFISHN